MESLYHDSSLPKKTSSHTEIISLCKVDGERVEMDPKQLYQRLLVAGIGNIDIQTLFKFELCSYPTSLFDQKLMMRQADKAYLQNALLKKAPASITEQIPADAVYVVDGGALLQRLPWPMSVSYAHLTNLYMFSMCTIILPRHWLYLMDMKVAHRPRMRPIREELGKKRVQT